MFQTEVVEKVKTFFLKIVPCMRCSKNWCSRTGHRWQYNMVLCVACQIP